MRYPRKLLGPNEKILFELRPHWIAIVPPAFFALAIIVGAVFLANRLDRPSWIDTAIWIVALVLFIIFAARAIVKWLFTLFVLTTDRMITRSGVISRRSKEIPLENINDVTFNQRMLERLVGAGDILVESAGERGQNRITNVRKPEDVQRQIYLASEENSNRMHRGGLGPQHFQQQAPQEDRSIPAQIEALARLKEQGVISAAEFETKKEELLKRL
jgi:uncharacterized membrane protein YdbT with pleckstrin-like domain